MRAPRSTNAPRYFGSWSQGHDPGVRFDVGLIDHVEAELVAQVVEAVVVGVVRAAHGVDVVPLHGDEVVTHVGQRDGLAGAGMVIVTVDPVDLHRSVVDQQLPVADLDGAEAHPLADDLAHAPVRGP